MSRPHPLVDPGVAAVGAERMGRFSIHWTAHLQRTDLLFGAVVAPPVRVHSLEFMALCQGEAMLFDRLNVRI